MGEWVGDYRVREGFLEEMVISLGPKGSELSSLRMGLLGLRIILQVHWESRDQRAEPCGQTREAPASA